MEESKGKFKIVKQEDAGSESDEEECVHGHFIQAEENDNSFSNKKKKIVLKKGSAAAGGGGGGGGVLRNCQVDKCTADMSSAKQYHKRHRVCEVHAKAQVVVVAGIRQRFCQQCSRFHELSEFDETKRSCRRRLAGHNERRRKSTAEHHAEGSNRKVMDAQLKEMVCGQVNDSSRIKIAVQENSTNYKHFQIS